MGAGIAQFILVLVTLALRNPPYVFIDEPELHLHPRLQAQVLSAIERLSRRGVVFATHSFGLAHQMADRIYTVSRVDDSHSVLTEYSATPELTLFLGELGFSMTRELGFTNLLLVEGKHDVRTYQALLRLYGKYGDVAILPLGGRQSIGPDAGDTLAEAVRVCRNVHVILDSDRGSPNRVLKNRWISADGAV